MTENTPPPATDLTPGQLLDGVPGLRLADRDWRALASMRHPVKVAIWLALMRPTEELLARESFIEIGRPDSEGVTEVRSIPAIVSWAETIVRRGIRGDMTASAMIADRIEGKIGPRRGDEDENDSRRGDMQAVIESVVRSLVSAKMDGNSALDITPVSGSPHVTDAVLDNERQDSDTARRNELAEERRREEADTQARGETLVETNQEPEERDLTDPLEGPRVIPRTNGQANGHG